MSIQGPIARTCFVGRRSDGVRKDIIIEIGKPYLYGPDEWACPISLSGLHDNLRDVHGGDALQALCLALRRMHQLLTCFQEDGGRLEFASGDAVPLDAYFFVSSDNRAE